MFLENKFNYQKGSTGKFWASEINLMNAEFNNITGPFFAPSKSDSRQLSKAINYIAMSQFWRATVIHGEPDKFIMLRKNDKLVTVDLKEDLIGFVKFDYTNIGSNVEMGFLNVDKVKVLIKGKVPLINQIAPSEIYVWLYEKVSNELVFNLFPITLTGDTTVNMSSGKTITTERILIENNKIILNVPVNGNIIFNTIHVYNSPEIEDFAFDTFNARVNPENIMEVLIDGDVNGKYGVVSYTSL